jgi:hypothetical protein
MNKLLELSGVDNIRSPFEKALDLLKGFLVMLDTAIEGNPKWTLFDILHDWSITELNEDIDDEPEFYNHTILRLYISLVKTGHAKFMAVPSRRLLELYKIVSSDEYWELSEKEIKKLTFEIGKTYNFIPYNYA